MFNFRHLYHFLNLYSVVLLLSSKSYRILQVTLVEVTRKNGQGHTKPHLKCCYLFYKSKVSEGHWYLGNSDYFHVKDWIKDTFTAHS